MGIVDKAKQAAIAATVTKALDYLEKDPETNIPKIKEMVDKVTPDGWYAGQRNAIRHSIEAKDNWYQLILRMYQLDAGVRQTFFRNFIVNASLKGSATQEKVSEENDCNVPWAILLDPTSACNLHCTGCWAAEYGHKLNLDLEPGPDGGLVMLDDTTVLDRALKILDEINMSMQKEQATEPMQI